MPRLPRQIVEALVKLLHGPIAREGIPQSAKWLHHKISFPGKLPKSLARLLIERAEAEGATRHLGRLFPEPLLPGVPDYTLLPFLREKFPEFTRRDIADLIKVGGRPHAYLEGLGEEPTTLPMNQAQILLELVKMMYQLMP